MTEVIYRLYETVDELTTVIETARSVPMSASCMVPRDHLLDLLDDLRESLPEEVLGVLGSLGGGGWLAPSAVVVVERSSREQPWEWPTPFVPLRERRYGEALLRYGRSP